MTDFSDNSMMQQVKDGQIQSLGLLFERYKVPLYNYFLRNTSNPDQSEDLVQNVFFRIIKYRHRFQGFGQFKSWMYRIAHNVLMDESTKRTHQALEESVMPDAASPEEVWQRAEQKDILNKALNRIPAQEREIIILSRFQGLRYKEIAEIYDISESAVKVRIFRAMKNLKDVYSRMER